MGVLIDESQLASKLSLSSDQGCSRAKVLQAIQIKENDPGECPQDRQTDLPGYINTSTHISQILTEDGLGMVVSPGASGQSALRLRVDQ